MLRTPRRFARLDPADDALGAGEERRATIGPHAASGAGASGSTTDHAHQRDPQALHGTGIVTAKGATNVGKLIELIADPEDGRLPDLARDALAVLGSQLETTEIQVRRLERELLVWHRSNEASRRLENHPGRWADHSNSDRRHARGCDTVSLRTAVRRLDRPCPKTAFQWQ